MWNLLKIGLETIFGKLGETIFIGSKLVVVGLNQILCINNMETFKKFIFKVVRCNVLDDVLFGALSFI